MRNRIHNLSFGLERGGLGYAVESPQSKQKQKRCWRNKRTMKQSQNNSTTVWYHHYIIGSVADHLIVYLWSEGLLYTDQQHYEV